MSTTNSPTTCLHTFRPGEVRCVCGAHRVDCDCSQCEPAASIKCPPWCADDHADDEPGRKHGEWFHHSETLDADDMRVQAVYTEGTSAGVTPGETAGVFVDVGPDQCLTPQRARGIASAIVQAAAMVEELAPVGVHRASRTDCPTCQGKGWTVADLDADGYGHWQPCDCKPQKSTGPVECAPWCVDGNGHPALFRVDQWCRGAELLIPLPAYRVPINAEMDPCGLYPDHLAVMPVRRWTQGQDVDSVLVFQQGPDSELSLTPAQARQLVSNLLLAVAALDAGQGAAALS